MEITFSDMVELKVRAADDVFGRIKDVLFDDRSFRVRYFVIDTSKWLPGRHVLLSPDAISGFDTDEGVALTGLTREEVEGAPSITEDLPVSRQYEELLHQHYGWPYYWMRPELIAMPYPSGAYPAGFGAPPPDELPSEWRSILESRQQRRDYHLRSADEVAGYRIHTKDDEFGEVRDFIVSHPPGIILDLVLASRRWLPGGKLTVCSPLFVTDFDTSGRVLSVDLTREDILSAPPFDWSRYGPDYRAAVTEHYLKRGRGTDVSRPAS